MHTVWVERQHGTDRHRNAREGRKAYRFSKDCGVPEAMTYFTAYSYNFRRPVRTLQQEPGARATSGRGRGRRGGSATGSGRRRWRRDSRTIFGLSKSG